MTLYSVAFAPVPTARLNSSTAVASLLRARLRRVCRISSRTVIVRSRFAGLAVRGLGLSRSVGARLAKADHDQSAVPERARRIWRNSPDGATAPVRNRTTRPGIEQSTGIAGLPS